MLAHVTLLYYVFFSDHQVEYTVSLSHSFQFCAQQASANLCLFIRKYMAQTLVADMQLLIIHMSTLLSQYTCVPT